jgi:Fe-S oxidoreductase
MGPLWISLLMLVSFAAFAFLAVRKLRIVTHLAPDIRWDHPAARLGSVLRNGFLQSRMIRREWKPGIMHAVIFLGFMALLARKLQLIAIGYYEPFTYPGIGGGLFVALKDVVELAVLAAVAFAFWRRYVQKPVRLEANREALLILSLITAIMITDFLFDGFRFALLAGTDTGIAHERAFAFAGSRVGDALSALAPETQRAGYVLSYWTQLLLVFAFLVILPLGEHFHIVTALPALFFRRGRPANRVPSVDLEKLLSEDADAAEVRVGVATARDLTWKEGLDVFTCTECGRCKDACPTFLTGKPLSQKWVHDSIKHHLLEQRSNIVADKPADDALPPLVGGVIGEDTLWACTTCGYCESACPIELEHLPRFFRMRQHRVMMDGEFPHELKAVFAAYESQGNPWGLSSDARADWARELDVPVVTTPEQMQGLDYLFYVGSAESFDPRGQKVARAIVAILREAGVSFGILGTAESSTGECVRRAGNEMLFQQMAGTLVGTLNGLSVTRIVTGDPHAFNSLRNEYPEFGGKYEVIHHTQLVARLLAEGRIRVDATFERVIYHEPCYLGRHNDEYEAPRAIIRQVVRDAPIEFALAREKSMCCGAGGGRMWLEEKIGTRINVARVEQALPQSPQVIATACPYCAVMMYDGVSALGRTDTIAVRDIAELVAESMQRKGAGPA